MIKILIKYATYVEKYQLVSDFNVLCIYVIPVLNLSMTKIKIVDTKKKKLIILLQLNLNAQSTQKIG